MRHLLSLAVAVCLMTGCGGERDQRHLTKLETQGTMVKISREQLTGRWKKSSGKREFILHDNGTAETFLGDIEHYRGTWRFTPPHLLLVRAVIPHNDPQIDDEVNAHEMAYAIREFSSGRFVAEEFDEEGLQEFIRK